MFFKIPIYFFACKRNPPNRFLISLKPVWKVFEKGLTEVPLLSIFGKVLTLEWPKMRWYEIQWDNMSLFFNSVPFRAVVKPNWKRGPKGPKWCFPNGWMDALQMVLSFQSARHSLQETVQNGKFQPAFPSRLLSSCTCTFSFPVSSFHFERLTTLTRGAWNRPVLSLKTVKFWQSPIACPWSLLFGELPLLFHHVNVISIVLLSFSILSSQTIGIPRLVQGLHITKSWRYRDFAIWHC